MFHNDWTSRRLARDRQRELLWQAAQERLARQAMHTPGRRRGRLTSWLGRQLIAAGQRLQATHKTTMTVAALRPARRSR